MYPKPEVPVSAQAVGPKNYIVVLKSHVDDEAAEAHISSITAMHTDRVSISSETSSEPCPQGVGHTYSFNNFKGYCGAFHSETLEHIKCCSEVDFVEEDQIMTMRNIISQKNVPSWGLARISQSTKADLSTYYYDESAGEGATVYVIDTGINITHAEFEGRATWGYNATTAADKDTEGHGTHVAGTIGGVTYGVAKKAKLVAVKVLGDGGTGSTSGVIKGIEWAASDARSKGISAKCVANMSLGGGYSAALNRTVDAAIGTGMTIAVAAGNDGRDLGTDSPASVKAAITVGASAKDDTKPSWSDFGSVVDVFAPGHNITSAWIGSNTATNTISGTSMATPHVAGLAAYLIAAECLSGSADVTARILKLAKNGVISNPGPKTTNALIYNGSGR